MIAAWLFFPALACQILGLAATLAQRRREKKGRSRPGHSSQERFALFLFLAGVVGAILYALPQGNILLAVGQSIFAVFCMPMFLPDRARPADTRDKV